MNEGLIDSGLVDPTATVQRERRRAERIDALDGLRIGLLDNSKDNANLLLDRIAEQITSTYDVAETIRVQKFMPSMVATDDQIQQLSERCDAVITAIAD